MRGNSIRWATFTCGKRGATKEGRCLPKTCPKCGSAGTVTKKG